MSSRKQTKSWKGGIVIPASLAMLTLGATSAQGQTIELDGSDTLTDIVNGAITASGSTLHYNNLGSSSAEKNMATLSGARFLQGIGPMSRNFTQAVLTAHPTWAPTATNVIALDAGVIVSRNYTGRCKDLTIPLANALDPTQAASNTMLGLILGGVDGKGTMTACADPVRLAAIAQLTECAGVPELSHFYRRDDVSGTTDTFKERLAVPRFCNGRAPGNFGAPGSNLFNDDSDPVRRACVPADGTHVATKCTYYPTSVVCAAGAAPDAQGRPCTQGFLVALSENDPGAPDITVSIGNRVKNDTFNSTAGFAGREAVRQAGFPTLGITLNTVNFTDSIIRQNQYMIARKLYLQRNPAGTGEPVRDQVEGAFFTWATNRCNLEPIVKQYGFITCLDDCTVEPSGPSNLCSLPSTPAAASAKPNLPVGANCDGSSWCASTGATCASPATCPMPAGFAAGFACSTNSNCASNNCVIGSNPLAGICQ